MTGTTKKMTLLGLAVSSTAAIVIGVILRDQPTTFAGIILAFIAGVGWVVDKDSNGRE